VFHAEYMIAFKKTLSCFSGKNTHDLLFLTNFEISQVFTSYIELNILRKLVDIAKLFSKNLQKF